MWSRIREFAKCFRVHYNRNRLIINSVALSWPFQAASDEELDCESTTKSLFVRSMFYIARSDFSRADGELHRLLHHLAGAYQERQIDAATYCEQRARVCSELANVNLLLRRYTVAEALIKQTVQDCVRAGLAVTDPTIVELSLKLVLIYQQLGRVEECALGFRFCIGTQERKLENNLLTDTDQMASERALLGMSYNYFSQFLYTQGELAMALEYAEKALSFALLLYPANHSNCLNLMSDLTTILIDQNRLNEARAVSEKAYQLGLANAHETNADVSPESLFIILTQLVIIECKSGNLEQAKRRLHEAERLSVQQTDVITEARTRLAHLKLTYGL